MLHQISHRVAIQRLFFTNLQKLYWIHSLTIGAIAVLLLFLIPQVFAATGQLANGERLEINCRGEHVRIDATTENQANIHCLPAVVIEPPEPLPTATPNNPTPSPVPTQQPEPTPNILPQSPFGLYPNCIAPAIGLEAQSWWHPANEAAPRQVKMATCLPNARSATGDEVLVSGELAAAVRITAVNNPATIEWLRYQWQRDTQDSAQLGQQCQAAVGEQKQCEWYLPLTIDTNKMLVSGMDEVKLTTNTRHNDLDSRQFPTLSFQLHHGGSDNYRPSPAPHTSSWYSGMRYANVKWHNYVELLNSAHETMPTVSGVLTLDVAHDVSKETCHRSAGFVDPHFDAFYAGKASEPIPFYDIAGCHEGVIELDTRPLSNGLHTIQLQTAVVATDAAGSTIGTHTAVTVYQVNVQNE